jgi:hypothetical protein
MESLQIIIDLPIVNSTNRSVLSFVTIPLGIIIGNGIIVIPLPIIMPNGIVTKDRTLRLVELTIGKSIMINALLIYLSSIQLIVAFYLL